MRVFCTNCSASKDPGKGLVPASQRYISLRIARVQDMAEREGVHFCILSGRFGLVDWNQPLPWYDHVLLPEEVPQLTEIVTRQLADRNITHMDYYMLPSEKDPRLVPYRKTIEEACQITGVELSVHVLEELQLSSASRNWKWIMEMAAEARQVLVINRAQGEQAFEELLRVFPNDGMIFFQRATGYESIRELGLARADYETARQRFPLERWQWEAQEASNRVAQELAAGGTIAEARRRVSGLKNVEARVRQEVLAAIEKIGAEPAAAAAALRRCMEILIRRLLDQHHITPAGDLTQNIRTLRDRSVVTEVVASHMHTVRILGNYAAHPRPDEPALQPGDIYPSVTALTAALEWLNLHGSWNIAK